MVLLIKHYFKSLLEMKKILLLLFILYLVSSRLSSFLGMVDSIVFPIIIVCYLTNKIENKDNEKFLNKLIELGKELYLYGIDNLANIKKTKIDNPRLNYIVEQ